MRVRRGGDLADGPANAADDLDLAGLGDRVKLAFEQVFMFYLSRICEHCLNPSCVASCPSGAMYRREEDGIVLVGRDRGCGWRFCVSGCPYKKVYFNHRTGKAERCAGHRRVSHPARPPAAASLIRDAASGARDHDTHDG